MGRISLGSGLVLLDAVVSGWSMSSYDSVAAISWTLAGLAAGSAVAAWTWADRLFTGAEPDQAIDDAAEA